MHLNVGGLLRKRKESYRWYIRVPVVTLDGLGRAENRIGLGWVQIFIGRTRDAWVSGVTWIKKEVR